MKLSHTGMSIQGQPMFEILERTLDFERQGIVISHFEIGEPDFETPVHIADAAVEAIRAGDTDYAPSSGTYDFKEAVIDASTSSRGLDLKHSQIVVTPGANALIYLALRCLVDPGEMVAVPDPGFPTYLLATHACGANPVPYKINVDGGFGLDRDSLIKVVDSGPRVLILNSPSNPTGHLLTAEEIGFISEVCRKKGVFLVSDEIYARLVFRNNKFVSASNFDNEFNNLLIINGFSKSFSMTGWRLGVGITNETLAEKMGLLVSTIVSCVPPFIQAAGTAAIRGDQSAQRMMTSEYQARAELMAERLDRMPGISCSKPAGAIYVFPNIRGTGLSSSEFFEFALAKARVAVCPGHFFGSNGEGFVRLSVVTAVDEIEMAMNRLEEALCERNK